MSLIEHAGTKHDMPTLDHILSKFKNEILDRTDLTLVSAQALRKTDQHQRATNLIERVLDKKWDEQIAREYGLISHENPAKSVVRAESWLDAHRDSPSLYLTLGRICRQAKLWGKAKNYLESSLNLNVSMETYAELASTHEQLDEHDDAQKYTRKGLALVQRVN